MQLPTEARSIEFTDNESENSRIRPTLISAGHEMTMERRAKATTHTQPVTRLNIIMRWPQWPQWVHMDSLVHCTQRWITGCTYNDESLRSVVNRWMRIGVRYISDKQAFRSPRLATSARETTRVCSMRLNSQHRRLEPSSNQQNRFSTLQQYTSGLGGL